MAEYLLRNIVEQEASGEIEVASAGTETMGGSGALAVTVTVMEELGIDITPHRSQAVTRKLLEKFDIVLGMTREHFDDVNYRAPDSVDVSVLGSWPEPPSSREHDIDDPFGQNMNRYRLYRDRIATEINRIFPMLRERAKSIRSE